jgi:hypothetical membrane protein
MKEENGAMDSILQEVSWFGVLGVTGCLVIASGALTAALAYRGRRGERFSPLNHFISELGEVGVSANAHGFNASLVAGGLLMVPFFIGLGLLIPGIWAKLGMGTGAVAALSCMSVGLFPMNRRLPHNIAAATYFRSGLVTVLLFTAAIWLQNDERVPRSLEAGGLVTAASYACFLFTGIRRFERARAESGSPVQTAGMEERPPLQAAPAAEWGVFLFTIGWVFVLGLSIS